jgi:hypothetical protein
MNLQAVIALVTAAGPGHDAAFEHWAMVLV